MKVTAQKVIERGSEGELIWLCLDVAVMVEKSLNLL